VKDVLRFYKKLLFSPLYSVCKLIAGALDGANDAILELMGYKKEIVVFKQLSGNCPICGNGIDNKEDLVWCGQCQTPHHLECYNWAGGCAVFGCNNQKSLPGSLAPEAKKKLCEKLN